MENTTNNTANTTTNVDFTNLASVSIHSDRVQGIKELFGASYLNDKPDANILVHGFTLWTWSPSLKTESSRLFNSKFRKDMTSEELGKLVYTCWLYASKYIDYLRRYSIVTRTERDSNGKIVNVILSFKPSSALRLAECEKALENITVNTTSMNMTDIRIWSYELECFVDINGNKIAGGLNTTKEDSMD